MTLQHEVTARGGQAVVHDPHEQQRVDVAAADDDADRPVARHEPTEHGGERNRTRRFHHLLGPLEQQHQRLADRLLVHADDLVDVGRRCVPR